MKIDADTRREVVLDFLNYLLNETPLVICDGDDPDMPATGMNHGEIVVGYLETFLPGDAPELPEWVQAFHAADKRTLNCLMVMYDLDGDGAESYAILEPAGRRDDDPVPDRLYDIHTDADFWKRVLGREMPAIADEWGTSSYQIIRYRDGVIRWEDMGGGCSYYWAGENPDQWAIDFLAADKAGMDEVEWAYDVGCQVKLVGQPLEFRADVTAKDVLWPDLSTWPEAISFFDHEANILVQRYLDGTIRHTDQDGFRYGLSVFYRPAKQEKPA